LPKGVDLDAEVRRVDPDRWLASRFIADQGARADVIALYAFDRELTRASVVTSSDIAAEIRLTWWRETLEEIYSSAGIRRHPVAEGVAAVAIERTLPRAPFEAMIDSRIRMLGRSRLETDDALTWAAGAEGSAARLAAQILDPAGDSGLAAPAGVVWGLVQLRRSGKAGGPEFDHCLRQALGEACRAARRLSSLAFPAALVATLARADLRTPSPSELEKRTRLAWSALTGRL
jgi:15-cis-phytoene synthase